MAFGNDRRRLVVVIEADSSDAQKAFQQTGKEADKTGRSVVTLSDKMGMLAQETERTASKQSKLTNSFKSAAIEKQIAQIARLDEKLRAMKEHVGINVHVDTDIDKPNGFFGKFAKLAGSFLKAGVEAGQSIGEGIGKAVSAASSNPYVMAGVIAVGGAIVTALSGFLASTASGLGLAAAAGGAVAIGIKYAMDDNRVQQAFQTFGSYVNKSLADASKVFVGPLISSARAFGEGFSRILPSIQRTLQTAAQYVRPLVDGVIGLVEKIMPGIEKAVRSAAPIIEVIKQALPRIGDAINDMFRSFSDNAPTATLAMQQLFFAIEIGIRTVSSLINGLTKMYGWLAKSGLLGKTVQAQYIALEIQTAELAKTTDNLGQQYENVAGIAKNSLVASMDDLQEAQDRVKEANDALSNSLANLGPNMMKTDKVADSLKTAMDQLYGAAIRQTDANEAYHASFDALKEGVKKNAGEFKRHSNNLSINSKAGRDNREMLEELLTKSNELYLADIRAGVSVKEATKRHENRTAAVKKEAEKVHLNKKETDNLINTYGRIPKKKVTDLILSGIQKIVKAMTELYILQRATAQGIPVASARAAYNNAGPTGTIKDFKAEGGPIRGPGSKTSDSVPIMASRGEFMERASAVDYYGVKLFEALNSKAIPREALASFAKGGQIFPVEASSKLRWPVSMSHTKLLTKAQALAKVIPALGTGIGWRKMMQALHGPFPGLPLISGFRPGARTLSGNVSYHALGRAVDVPANIRVAKWIHDHYARKTKELISPWRQFDIHNGSAYKYSQAIHNQHSGGNAHVHWAMDRVTDVEPGWFEGYNGTGKTERLVNADLIGSGVTVNPVINVIGTMTPAQKRQLAESLATEIRDALSRVGNRNGKRLGLTAA